MYSTHVQKRALLKKRAISVASYFLTVSSIKNNWHYSPEMSFHDRLDTSNDHSPAHTHVRVASHAKLNLGA
jgi:hypothetical protein